MRGSRAGRSRASTPGRVGFTLIDMVLTVLILGLIAAVVSPRYADSLERFRVSAAAGHIAADIRYARQQARIRGEARSVVFLPANNSYELPQLDSPLHPGRPFTVDLAQTAYPATLLSADFGAGGSTVTFDIYGRPDNAGTVVVQVGSQQQTIHVASGSGRVSVQ